VVYLLFCFFVVSLFVNFFVVCGGGGLGGVGGFGWGGGGLDRNLSSEKKKMCSIFRFDITNYYKKNIGGCTPQLPSGMRRCQFFGQQIP